MADGFSIAERAYRYGDHGIYISTKRKAQTGVCAADGQQSVQQTVVYQTVSGAGAYGDPGSCSDDSKEI